MSELSFDTPHGKLRVHGWCVDTMHAAAELGRELAGRRERRTEWIEFEGAACRLHARPISGALRLARGLRHRLGGRVPCIREYENLSWLIERHFQAVLPLAAGFVVRHGSPTYEYLITRREPGAVPLATALRAEPVAAPGAALESAGRSTAQRLVAELARELARMHALGFRHGDLGAHALLARPAGSDRRVVFRSAWASGPRPHRGSYEADLARLLECPDLGDDAARSLLEQYVEQRAAQDRAVDRGASGRRLDRERRKLR